MTPSRRLLGALTALLPLGALGVSAALAATPVPTATATRDVAQRLQAIRDAVSSVTVDPAGPAEGDPAVQRAWWGNGGPGWWRNGGWRNGWFNGWHNGPWGNWHNGWHNGPWGNWWHNW
jgi:rSAM-associated Gly-rich repeat protein